MKVTSCRNAGFSMIEVLVAVLILAIGLLGVAAMQTNALKSNQSAFQRSQATMLAYYMMDAMRANRSAAILGSYNLGDLDGNDPECSSPVGANLITNDQAAWFSALKANLGNFDTTCGLIACNVTSCTVKVFWDDSRAEGGEDNQIVELTSRI